MQWIFRAVINPEHAGGALQRVVPVLHYCWGWGRHPWQSCYRPLASSISFKLSESIIKSVQTIKYWTFKGEGIVNELRSNSAEVWGAFWGVLHAHTDFMWAWSAVVCFFFYHKCELCIICITHFLVVSILWILGWLESLWLNLSHFKMILSRDRSALEILSSITVVHW